MPKCTIPLWLVFTLQSLVVLVSFIAVILVLVLQQQDQFKTAVYEKIDLQLHLAEATLVGPLLTREKMFQAVVDRLEFDHSLRMQADNNISSTSIQRYLNLTFFSMYSDPLAYTFYQHRMHPTKRLPSNSTNGPLWFGVTTFTNEFIAGISNYDGTLTIAPNPTYPLQFAATFQAPLEISNLDWSNVTRYALTTRWFRPGVFLNTITGETQITTTLTHPLEISTALGVATLSVALTLTSKYLVDNAKASLLTPDSKGLLLEKIQPSNNYIIAGMNTDAPEYDVSTETLFTMKTFPDRSLVHHYMTTANNCPSTSNCTFYAQEHDDHVMSLIFITTQYGYRMHLFQITPRGYYFAAGEKSAVIGIVIGVVAAVVVLMSCVVIWFAVRGPVRRLRESMELAAVMRNDEVSDTSSVLTELDLLSQSFTQMNDKLLQARAFMPQSMLHGTDDSVDDNDAFSEGSISHRLGEWAAGRSHSGMIGVHELGASHLRYSANDNDVPMDALVGADSSVMFATSVRPDTSSQYSPGSLRPPILGKSALTLKKVAVLMINARGTHGLATSGGAAKLEREQVRLVELVERCACAEKGVVDAFQGDHFVLTFNAVRAVGSPGRNGALVGLSVEEGAQRDGLALGRFSMGLSVGRAHVGNVGSATMKKNCTVGGVYTNAAGLERLAKRVGRTCVVNGRCLPEIEVVAYCLAVGSVRMGDGQTDVLWAVMNKVGGSADEWLYELERAAQGNPYQVYNDVVHRLLNGEDTTSCLADLSSDQPQQVSTELSNLRAAVDQEGVACLKHQCI